ncbi:MULTISPECIES: aldo/keto reductase [unclassified Streptomyces]|uniref:aldo/keto reductase n=1 Tax=unclassified Streptomyces TaxID=2593676 RepID=UPI0023BA1794|nr:MULTISPECIES: aldo/keto reductase [unclassified Streptomyces]
MSKVPFITLNNGVRMPQLGFGVWQIPDDEAQVAVRNALDAGYRSIDTAAIYGNEEGTGKGLAASGIARDELFITTKLHNRQQGYDSTLRAFDASLTKLGLEYVDLYLIHWPLPGVDKYVDTWKAFEKIYSEGRAKAIGVSNFHPAHIQRLLSETSIVPVIDQIELHPQLPQAELRAFNARHDIATEAWSPLGQGKGLLEDPKLAAIGEKHGKSPAQVVLRWHLDLGNVVIPKSVTPSRIKENIDVFDFQLDSEDLAAIDSLETGVRLGFDPETFNG